MSVSVMEKKLSAPAQSGTPSDPAAARLTRRDLAAFVLTAAIALGVYVYTLAPNVTMEDSGELITAASLFGVAHPPGYPLWTMSGWLLTELLPLGSYAWRVNLLSALFGAAASGVLALLAASSGRWLLAFSALEVPTAWRERLSFYGGITAGLALAFSESMWSQAVIAEVYTLNALFLVSVLYALFRWAAEPGSVRWLLTAVLVYCLGMTNHHTLMLMLPAFVLLVALMRPRLLPSFLLGFSLLLLSVLAVFAWFSDFEPLHTITRRAAWLVLGGGLVLCFWFVRRWNRRLMLVGATAAALAVLVLSQLVGGWFEVETSNGVWIFVMLALGGALLATSTLHRGLVVGMLALGWLGLLPYGYLSLASHTNPPMNWAYPKERVGFYQLIGREQYENSLSRMIVKLANAGGLYDATPGQTETPGAKVGVPLAVADAVRQYGLSLDANFTTPLCLLALGVAFAFRSLAPPLRGWLAFLLVSFLFLAFAMSILEPPVSLDASFLWVTRVFKIQSHCIFVLAIAYGLILLGALLYGQAKEAPPWAAAGMLLLALLPLAQNAATCSMRHHWFGWNYGYKMLSELPENAVVFGGTDPGRFVPTYMIFGESTQPDRYKRAPGFDRRDLFIITQSQLAHSLYLATLHEQYGTPPADRQWSTLERWLGRPEQYPQSWLKLPDEAAEMEVTQEFALATGQVNSGQRVDFGGGRVRLLHALLARWIFEANKDRHEFFIEMHFPLTWAWPHLEPAGLLMRIAPEPLEEIPTAVIRRDRQYWAELTARLLANPLYGVNLPTRRAYSDARAFIAGLYRRRGLQGPAEEAYAQAFALGPENLPSVVFPYVDFLLELQDFETAEAVLDRAGATNPNSRDIPRLREALESTRQLVAGNALREARLKEEPGNYQLMLDLLADYNRLKRDADFDAMLDRVIVLPEVPREELVVSLQILAERGQLGQVERLLKLRLEQAPEDVELTYQLSAILAQQEKRDEALLMLRRALDLEPTRLFPVLRTDWRFDGLREDVEFRQLVPVVDPGPRIPVTEHLPQGAIRFDP
ncbi:MAG: DUF2723 domain-containing protein [Verrucomicrobiota bacterium]